MRSAVLFLVFNRPDTTRQVFEAIRAARPPRLYVAADGPRSTHEGDKDRCEEVRRIATAVDWPCMVKTLLRDVNLGCKLGVSGAINWFFANEEEGIILEDDCVPCPDYFRFCSEMLAYYRDNRKVMSIAGTNYQSGQVRGDGNYYFSRFPHIWGWASWRRAWKFYDVTMESWPKARQDRWIEKVCPSVEQNYWIKSFNQVYDGEIDTWDCQWLYACWRAEGIGIIPNVNLITNIGGGPDATHTKGEISSLAIVTGILGNMVHPKNMLADFDADRFTFETHFQPTFIRRLLSRIKKLVLALLRKSDSK